jgi:hypothetical protein
MLVLTRTISDRLMNEINTVTKAGLGYNGTEISGVGYARVNIPSGFFVYDSEDVTYYYYKNGSSLVFPAAGSFWGNMNEIYFFDSSNNKVYTFVTDSVIVIATGITFSINAGGLILKIKKSG